MVITDASFQDYRNLAAASFETGGGAPVFFVGANGQGKSNLLEGVGLVTALRSFRTQDNRNLVRWGRPEARVLVRVDHESLGVTEIEIRLRPGAKEVRVDGERVSRFADFVGRFPTVLMASQDIQLLRGSPQLRRRFLDLVLSAVDPSYLGALRRYHRALQARNRLLKRGAAAGEREAFEREMAPAAVEVQASRAAGLAAIGGELTTAYRGLAERDEEPRLTYRPDGACPDAEGFLRLMAESRPRDTVMQTTTRGPHRDDFRLGLFGRDAREAGSEGQQRGLVTALRLAQARWFQSGTGVRPALLIDDVLGELDPRRRAGFWTAVDPALQVLASGTSPPADGGCDRGWRIFDVTGGTVSR